MLFTRDAVRLGLRLDNAGRSIPAKIAMMAMTTSSSIRVKAPRREVKLLHCDAVGWVARGKSAMNQPQRK